MCHRQEALPRSISPKAFVQLQSYKSGRIRVPTVKYMIARLAQIQLVPYPGDNKVMWHWPSSLSCVLWTETPTSWWLGSRKHACDDFWRLRWHTWQPLIQFVAFMPVLRWRGAVERLLWGKSNCCHENCCNAWTPIVWKLAVSHTWLGNSRAVEKIILHIFLRIHLSLGVQQRKYREVETNSYITKCSETLVMSLSTSIKGPNYPPYHG